MKWFWIILLFVATICSAECFRQTDTDLRYIGDNKIRNYKAINAWMNLSADDDIDVWVKPIFYTNSKTWSVETVTITANHTDKTVIIAHKTTPDLDGTTIHWIDDVLVQFMDEYGLTHHTMTVKYDMPVTIYKKLCLHN